MLDKEKKRFALDQKLEMVNFVVVFPQFAFTRIFYSFQDYTLHAGRWAAGSPGYLQLRIRVQFAI
jgi:hypothetical protein